MFLCLLGEVVSYLFYSKRPTEVNWWIHPNHISPQRTRKKRRARKKIQAQVFSVNLAEFLRTPPVAASEVEYDETKLLHMTSRLKIFSELYSPVTSSLHSSYKIYTKGGPVKYIFAFHFCTSVLLFCPLWCFWCPYGLYGSEEVCDDVSFS